MKKITLLFATIFSIAAFAQETETESFATATLEPVPTAPLDNSYFSTIPNGYGKWFAAGNGVEFGIQPTGGNPANYVSRISESQFARGLAYVYNNKDNSASGVYTLKFDYFFNTSFDNVSTTNERFGYRVYGITSDTPTGTFALTSGSGDFGDDNSTAMLNDATAVQLKSHTHLPHTNTWASSGDFTIDLGAAGTYKYFVVVFGQVFGGSTAQTGNPVATYFGIDNVVLPKQSKPALSAKQFEKTPFTVYPNPAKNEVSVSNIQGEFSYNIYDVAGKITKSSTKQASNTINISDLNAGVYFMEITNSDNRKSTTKLIKL
jgi:Secretion system C-terminal sorting domain